METKQPPPGSKEAVKLGCTCPVLDNDNGAGLGNGLYWISAGCPVHDVAEATPPASEEG